MSLGFVFVFELRLCLISLYLEGPAISLVADLVTGYNVSIHVIRYSTSGHMHTLSHSHSFSSKYLWNTYHVLGIVVNANDVITFLTFSLHEGYIPEVIKGIFGMEKIEFVQVLVRLEPK